MVTGDFFDDFESVLHELGADLVVNENDLAFLRSHCSQCSVEDLLHELRREYTRLFIKTSKEPVVGIWEALFKWDADQSGNADQNAPQPLLFINDDAMKLMDTYKMIGLARSSDFNNSEDHFAFQFIFLSKIHLILSLAEDEYSSIDELLQDYMETRFKGWGPAFFLLCEQKTEVEAYRVFWRIGRTVSELLLRLALGDKERSME